MARHAFGLLDRRMHELLRELCLFLLMTRIAQVFLRGTQQLRIGRSVGIVTAQALTVLNRLVRVLGIELGRILLMAIETILILGTEHKMLIVRSVWIVTAHAVAQFDRSMNTLSLPGLFQILVTGKAKLLITLFSHDFFSCSENMHVEAEYPGNGDCRSYEICFPVLHRPSYRSINGRVRNASPRMVCEQPMASGLFVWTHEDHDTRCNWHWPRCTPCARKGTGHFPYHGTTRTGRLIYRLLIPQICSDEACGMSGSHRS